VLDIARTEANAIVASFMIAPLSLYQSAIGCRAAVTNRTTFDRVNSRSSAAWWL
jgi:hypothetical protein